MTTLLGKTNKRKKQKLHVLYSHPIGEISRKGCNMAYNGLEFLSYAQSKLATEEY